MRGLAALFFLVCAACGFGERDEIDRFDAPRSGASFLQPDTRALQDDDFANPGFLWVDRGEAMFKAAAGGAPSCKSCHGDRALVGAAARYPRIDPETGALFNLEAQINACRVRRQRAAALDYESDGMLALTAYVAHLSRSAPIEVEVSGPARPYYDAGRAYFYTRRGQFNLSCHQCHDEAWGRRLRGDTISQGHPNGFPAYRLEWQSLGSLHRRLQDCDAGVRAEPFPLGSETYTALELYLAARAAGLKAEAPGVRR